MKPNDERIKGFLEAIESATGQQIDSVVSGASYFPKKIPGDRLAFINQWLETPNKFGTPGTLTNGITKQHMLLVTIKNMRPESIPPNPNSPLGPPVSFFDVQMDEDSGYHLIFAPIFGTMATQLKSHWGVLRSPKLSQQISRSKAMYRQMEKLAVHPKERELLEQQRHQYTYDIGRSHIIGLGPNGEKFNAYLDWINYWGDSLAASLGFPDNNRDKPLENLYQRIDDAGWVVRLTGDPTDLDNPEDLDKVQWASERFNVSTSV